MNDRRRVVVFRIQYATTRAELCYRSISTHSFLALCRNSDALDSSVDPPHRIPTTRETSQAFAKQAW